MLLKSTHEIGSLSPKYFPSIYLQHNTIETVLERGEKLDDLVEKSEGLTLQSKAFYKTVSNFTKLPLQCQTVLTKSSFLSYIIVM